MNGAIRKRFQRVEVLPIRQPAHGVAVVLVGRDERGSLAEESVVLSVLCAISPHVTEIFSNLGETWGKSASDAMENVTLAGSILYLMRISYLQTLQEFTYWLERAASRKTVICSPPGAVLVTPSVLGI